MWYHLKLSTSGLNHEASYHAAVLMFPYVCWNWLAGNEDFTPLWMISASAVPCTEEVARSVVDTLLQIASQSELLPYIPIDVWSWLTKRPTLPPICLGRDVGTRFHVIEAVRGLRDIEVLKAYFLLIWSEWNDLSSNGPLERPLPSPISKEAEASVLDSMPRSHPPEGSGMMWYHRPRNFFSAQSPHLYPRPNRALCPPQYPIPNRAPSPHPPTTSHRVLSIHLPNVSDHRLNPHQYSVPVRTPIPHPPSIPDHVSSIRSPNASNSMLSCDAPHTPNITPPPQPLYIRNRTPSLHQFHVPENSSSRHQSNSPENRSSLYLPHYPITSDRPVRSPSLGDSDGRWYVRDGFTEMTDSIREDFGGFGMRSHRADLIQRLDHILGELDRGPDYLKQHNPEFETGNLPEMKDHYQILRRILLDEDLKAISRAFHPKIAPSVS